MVPSRARDFLYYPIYGARGGAPASTMNTETVRQRALAFLLGAAALLLAAELGLRAVGALVARGPLKPPGSAARYTVLCLGDSFTAGREAPKGEDYPSQLARLLEARAPGRFRVINGGVQGQNTHQLLLSLPGDLEAVAPDAVLLLSGGANSWNYYGYHAYRYAGSPSRLRDALYRVRLFKLALLLAKGGTGKGARAAAPPPAVQCEPAPGLEKIKAIYREAAGLDAAGDRLGAAEALKRAAALDPGNAKICRDIAELCLAAGEAGEARAWIARGLEAPRDCDVNWGRPSSLRGPLNVPTLRDLDGWLSHDLEKIGGLLKEKGIKLLLMNYPPRAEGLYLPENFSLIAGRLGAPLVDNHAAFTRALAEGRELFNGDPFGHCNAAGHALVAETAAAVLLRPDLFPEGPPPLPARR